MGTPLSGQVSTGVRWALLASLLGLTLAHQAALHDSQDISLLPEQLYRQQHEESVSLLQAQQGKTAAQQQQAWQDLAVKHAMQHLLLMQSLRNKQQQGDSQDQSRHQQGSNGQAEEGQLCVVVRTYQAHGPGPGDSPGPLRQLIDTLSISKHTKWQVLFVVSDGKPFPALQQMVDDLNDKRISIHTYLVGPEHAARDAVGNWNQDYHHMLFRLTDKAIADCPRDTRWVTLTNGDNAYDPRFWEVLGQQPAPEQQAGPHILAFDFYSRYQRHTGPQCYRFEAGPHNPPCKQNMLRFCQTDLASVALDWQRWMSEGRVFAGLSLSDWEKRQGWHDGLGVHAIVSAGWRIKWVAPGSSCLVAHSPNAQMCAMEGGVWDDTGAGTTGGRCLSIEEADGMMQHAGLQIVDVQLSHDPASFLPEAAQSTGVDPLTWPTTGYTIKCIRQLHEIPTVQMWNNPEFNSKCTALVDQPDHVMHQAQAWLQEAQQSILPAAAGAQPVLRPDEL